MTILFTVASAEDVDSHVVQGRENAAELKTLRPEDVSAEPPPRADRNALNEVFGERLIAQNVRQVRRQAARLGLADRFAFLSRWVLPGETHTGFRVSGEFTQTDPSPLALEQQLEPRALPGGKRNGRSAADSAAKSPDTKLPGTLIPPPRGGEITSPVFDLIDTAAEAGRLEELRDRIARIAKPRREFDRRAKAALLLLVSLELDDQEAASMSADDLYALVADATPKTLADMWPETLVVYRGVHRFEVNRVVADLLNSLYAQRTQNSTPQDVPVWHTHITALFGGQRHQQRGGKLEALETPLQLPNWVPLTT